MACTLWALTHMFFLWEQKSLKPSWIKILYREEDHVHMLTHIPWRWIITCTWNWMMAKYTVFLKAMKLWTDPWMLFDSFSILHSHPPRYAIFTFSVLHCKIVHDSWWQYQDIALLETEEWDSSWAADIFQEDDPYSHLSWLSIHLCHGPLLYQTLDMLHKASLDFYDFFWDEMPHGACISAIMIERNTALVASSYDIGCHALMSKF